ncbi:MAG: hypothetical protein IIY81_04935, partial [Lachnospiraceae bacterium]|nr:hypothetical protein [Lachnospiraceae bacterium]
MENTIISNRALTVNKSGLILTKKTDLKPKSLPKIICTTKDTQQPKQTENTILILCYGLISAI